MTTTKNTKTDTQFYCITCVWSKSLACVSVFDLRLYLAVSGFNRALDHYEQPVLDTHKDHFSYLYDQNNTGSEENGMVWEKNKTKHVKQLSGNRRKWVCPCWRRRQPK